MPTIFGPHIPYKQWAANETPDPVQDHMNWLEVERWAARLSEQVAAASSYAAYWTFSDHGLGSVLTPASEFLPVPASTTLTYNVGVLGDNEGVLIERDGQYVVSVSITWQELGAGSPLAGPDARVGVSIGGTEDAVVQVLGKNHASVSAVMELTAGMELRPVLEFAPTVVSVVPLDMVFSGHYLTDQSDAL